MRVAYYPQFLEILRDLSQLLTQAPDCLLYYREGEPSPNAIPLHFKPTLAEKTVARIVKNNVCTLCVERLSYKPNQFEKARPNLPFLIVIHNHILKQRDVFFQDSRENELFLKIIQNTTGYHPQEFLVREALRCHFLTENQSIKPQWFQNCLKHLQEDIACYHIRGMLVMGEAATILVPEREKLKQMLGKVVNLWGVPTVFTIGPRRIVFLEKKKRPPQEILAEKKKIFAAVSLFKKEVMGIP